MSNMCKIEDFKDLSLTKEHREMLSGELETWHRVYLPVGDTVLDVGAGCGETALLYLNHGAKKVICIECDPEALKHLRKNFSSDDRVLIVNVRIDSIKIDIEGSEDGLVIETHFPFKMRKMYRHFLGYAELWRLQKDWGNIMTKALRKIRRKMKLS